MGASAELGFQQSPSAVHMSEAATLFVPLEPACHLWSPSQVVPTAPLQRASEDHVVPMKIDIGGT